MPRRHGKAREHNREGYLLRALPVRWRSNGATQVLDVAQRGCRTLFRKAMFLAGDAAHQLSPNGALGTNSGIGDAVDLGWKLGCGAERCGGEGFSVLLRRRAPADRHTERQNDDPILSQAQKFGVRVCR